MLIVVDTLRADAVSAYGSVEGTTPAIDDLAARGLRYTLAFAPSSWTLPSHASLLTGLRPDQHGVGLAGTNVLPAAVETLAESLRDAGYETAGFSENSLVAPLTGLDQGFDTYDSINGFETAESVRRGTNPFVDFDVVGRVSRWLRTRENTRPYFLFVNLYDAHDPYEVRETNAHLPTGVSRDHAEAVIANYSVPEALCGRLPAPEEIAILRGLYLGDVAAADRKVGEILRTVDAYSNSRDRFTIVTSDHGEHFGEHRLLGHRFSIRNAALSVPLVVTGPAIRPGVVDRAVAMQDLYGSILCWTTSTECDRALPTENAPMEGQRPIVSVWSDEFRLRWVPEGAKGEFSLGGDEDHARRACSAEDRVFGRMVSVIDHPTKLIWYDRYTPSLHDLSWDPAELSNIIEVEPRRAEPLEALLGEVLEGAGMQGGAAGRLEVEGPIQTELRRLGYID